MSVSRKSIVLHVIKGLFLCLPLLLSLKGKAQSDNLNIIQNDFNRLNNRLLKEKIYLHTDREAYLAGEILWFKAYILSSDLKLTDLSKVLYVELIGAGNKSVLQAKVSLKSGTGKGSVVLPSTIPTGNYQLRAYTSLLKNFGANAFFKKNISVINVQSNTINAASSQTGEYTIRLIPEGGSLINGIESKVAFKVTGKDSKGVSFKGAVINEHNDTVLHFKPLRFGIGTFTIKPLANEKYRVTITTDNGKSTVSEFPEVLERGYAMRAEPLEGKIKISIRSNISASSRVILIGHASNRIKFADQQILNSGGADFVIDKNALPDGVTYFTLFDENRKPVAERLYFKFPENNVDVTVNSDSSAYHKRQKAKIEIATSGKNSSPVACNLSMSVFYPPSNLSLQPTDIVAYTLLTSELKGIVENPGSYFKESGEQRELLIDNLMLAYGWNGTGNISLLKDQYSTVLYLPEYEGHIVSVLLKNVKTNMPAPGIVAFLSVPGKRVQLYTARTDSNGIARFNTKDLYGANEVILQLHPDYRDNFRAELLSPFSDAFSNEDIIYGISAFADSIAKGIWKTSLNMQVTNIFSRDKLNRYILPDIDSSAFFGTPGKTYLLDDYTRFTTTEEVFREYIPEIWLQRKSGGLKLAVANQQGTGLFNSEPLMLLDGVPVFQSDQILRYDPLKIKSIDIVASRYYWGPTSFDGIVSFKTYKGNLDNFELDPKDVVVDYEGLLEERKFYLPEYTTNEQLNNPTPDFRNVLYWSPDIKTDAATGKTTVEFYTSDQKGLYVGNLQGLAQDGSLISQFFTILVK